MANGVAAEDDFASAESLGLFFMWFWFGFDLMDSSRLEKLHRRCAESRVIVLLVSRITGGVIRVPQF